MANAFRKAANFIGLVDDEESAMAAPEVAKSESRFSRQVRATTVEQPQQPQSPTYLRSAALRSAPALSQSPVAHESAVVDRIVTLHPRMYSDVRGIGEHYRLGQPVIMNLSDMEESERKRMIDFASGLVFGHYGSIERVTSKVFLLTPPNVMVSNEDRTAAAQANFFNQS